MTGNDPDDGDAAHADTPPLPSADATTPSLHDSYSPAPPPSKRPRIGNDDAAPSPPWKSRARRRWAWTVKRILRGALPANTECPITQESLTNASETPFVFVHVSPPPPPTTTTALRGPCHGYNGVELARYIDSSGSTTSPLTGASLTAGDLARLKRDLVRHGHGHVPCPFTRRYHPRWVRYQDERRKYDEIHANMNYHFEYALPMFDDLLEMTPPDIVPLLTMIRLVLHRATSFSDEHIRECLDRLDRDVIVPNIHHPYGALLHAWVQAVEYERTTLGVPRPGHAPALPQMAVVTARHEVSIDDARRWIRDDVVRNGPCQCPRPPPSSSSSSSSAVDPRRRLASPAPSARLVVTSSFPPSSQRALVLTPTNGPSPAGGGGVVARGPPRFTISDLQRVMDLAHERRQDPHAAPPRRFRRRRRRILSDEPGGGGGDPPPPQAPPTS